MKILLLGKNGQVGWELQRALAPLGDLVALDRKGKDGICGDLNCPDTLARSVRHLAPDVIVNAAAYTAVDKAESDADQARRINAEAVSVLAAEAATIDALLVHYSSDYVFDGSGTKPWREEDVPAPLSVYGRTKLEGEQSIVASGCRYLIFRTSWVYASRGHNFAKTILRLASERERLTVIDDQRGAPTGAELIADVTAHAIRTTILRPELSGLYHLVASGETTWHGYATYVIEQARALGQSLKVHEIIPISTRDYPTPATRPLNSRLDTSKLTASFNLTLPYWAVGVERMLHEILEP